jgi:hypothetical protein
MNKRQSARLAQKAAINSGKGSMEVAQELLAKKLGELGGNMFEKKKIGRQQD